MGMKWEKRKEIAWLDVMTAHRPFSESAPKHWRSVTCSTRWSMFIGTYEERKMYT